MKRYRPKVWLDLSDSLNNLQIHGLDVGYDNHIYIVATTEHIKSRDGGKVVIRTDKPHDYVILRIDNDKQVATFNRHSEGVVSKTR